MPFEQRLSHTRASLTISHCSSSQLILPSGGKQRPTQRLSKLGQRELSLSDKTYQAVLTTPLWTNVSGFFQTRNPGWREKSVHSSKPATLPSGQGTGSCTALPELNWREAAKRLNRLNMRRIDDHLTDNDPRQVWQGGRHITNFKGSNPTTANADALLAEKLIRFFAVLRLKGPNLNTPSPPATNTETHALTVQEHEVRRAHRSVNSRKAAGPDGLPQKVLKACAVQISAVFTNVCNLSLAQALPCQPLSFLSPRSPLPMIWITTDPSYSHL